jgi:hypothetical protein
MKNVATRSPYWISGTLVALGGAATSRFLAPLFDGGARIGISIGGQVLALAGLAVICVGVSRRVRGRPEATDA